MNYIDILVVKPLVKIIKDYKFHFVSIILGSMFVFEEGCRVRSNSNPRNDRSKKKKLCLHEKPSK